MHRAFLLAAGGAVYFVPLLLIETKNRVHLYLIESDFSSLYFHT